MNPDSYRITTLPKPMAAIPATKPKPLPKPPKPNRPALKACQCGKSDAFAEGVFWHQMGMGRFVGHCLDCGYWRIADRKFLGGRQSVIVAEIPPMNEIGKRL